MPAFSLAHSPRLLTVTLPPMHDAPLPKQQKIVACRGFGGVLEPHYIVGAEPLDQ